MTWDTPSRDPDAHSAFEGSSRSLTEGSLRDISAVRLAMEGAFESASGSC